MRDHLDELGDNTSLALITFTDPENLAGYTADHGLPFPVLVDPTRSAYRAFGLGRGSIARIYGLKAAHRYLQLFAKNGITGLSRPTEDTLQLGGDFIVAPDGSLAYGFWGEGPDDRPSVGELINAIRTIRA